MSVLDKCRLCQLPGETLSVCSSCRMVCYCCKEHQVEDWPSHKQTCCMIPGTNVKKDTPLGPNPLDPHLKYPKSRNGSSQRKPLPTRCLFKVLSDGREKMRLIRLGKLSSLNSTIDDRPIACQLRPLPNGKYRHIASFSLDELRRLGWRGCMYTASEGEHAANGMWVPFLDGYDSEPELEYEPFDVHVGRRAGTVGIDLDDVGKYIEIPSRGTMQLSIPEAERTL